MTTIIALAAAGVCDTMTTTTLTITHLRGGGQDATDLSRATVLP